MVIYLLIWLFARKCIFHIYFPEVCALCRYYIWSKQIATFQSSDSTQNRPPPGERWYRLIKTRLERAHKFGIPSGGFLAARWINVANCNCRGNFASALLVLSAPPAPNCFNKANNKDLELHFDFLMILKAFYTIHSGSWHDSCLVLLSGVPWLVPCRNVWFNLSWSLIIAPSWAPSPSLPSSHQNMSVLRLEHQV